MLTRNFFFIREAGGMFLGANAFLVAFDEANIYHSRENAEKMIRSLERTNKDYVKRGLDKDHAHIAERVARVYTVVEGSCQVG